MTIIEAHLAFKFGLDKIDSLNYPNVLPEEIDLLLNQGYKKWVKQRYGLTNVKHQSFEETQKRTEDLKNLIQAVILTPLAYNPLNIDSNARYVTLPTDHWFIIQERAEVSYIDCVGGIKTKLVEVRPTQHLEFDKVINDAFKKPDNTKVLRLMENGQVELVSSPGISITSYRLRYLKQPVTVNLIGGITFETSEHTHQEIVDTSIQLALEDIESKRLGSFTQIVDNQKE